MFNTIVRTLNNLGLNGSTVIIIALGLYGYFKLAKNHFKHLNDRFTGLEQGQLNINTKFDELEVLVIDLDKKVGILEALGKK